jgi:hypothetical protein
LYAEDRIPDTGNQWVHFGFLEISGRCFHCGGYFRRMSKYPGSFFFKGRASPTGKPT